MPPLDYHPAIEFSNRMIALAGILAALLTWLSARRIADRTARRLAGGTALLTFGQIPLGALTVLFDLHPLLVMSHFLVAVVATGLAAALWARLAGGSSTPAPARLAWLARLSIAGAFALIVSGAFSTAAGPARRRPGHPPHGQPARQHLRARPRRDDLRRDRDGAAPAAAVRPMAARPLARPRARADRAAALQAFIGEYQWHNQLPWGVVLAHVSVAAAVWIVCVSLATRVVARRPVA